MDAALTAEVKALLETIEARGFLRSLNRCLGEAERLVAAEQGETPLVFPQFSMTWDYFAVFEALRPKLGLLPAQRTSLVTCFYVAAKSSCEMLIRRPEQPLARFRHGTFCLICGWSPRSRTAPSAWAIASSGR
ncbi:hypothetical protein [Sphingomonas gellani]|uniref:hypothetical protein n=1 Tax=Sphingomonas gellani TaxID=1166340 RepID=UPI001113B94A|nr:hypothetical protein [Sphingomonas gellani]